MNIRFLTVSKKEVIKNYIHYETMSKVKVKRILLKTLIMNI